MIHTPQDVVALFGPPPPPPPCPECGHAPPGHSAWCSQHPAWKEEAL